MTRLKRRVSLKSLENSSRTVKCKHAEYSTIILKKNAFINNDSWQIMLIVKAKETSKFNLTKSDLMRVNLIGFDECKRDSFTNNARTLQGKFQKEREEL